VIRGGLVVDGSGAPARQADVGLAGGRVAALAPAGTLSGGRTWTARGKVVCPGFVDIHGHSEFSLLVDGRGLSKVLQGVTTEVVGNCGLAPAPLVGGAADYVRGQAGFIADLVPWGWETMAAYRRLLRHRGVSPNVVVLAGHRTLRAAVAGQEDRELTPAEEAAMGRLLEQALSEGAHGLSTGLQYAPGTYAPPDEIEALCRLLARRGGFYASHTRDDGAAGAAEAEAIAAASGQPVEISHYKAAGREPGEGVLGIDVYPYTHSSTWLSAFLPPWVGAGGPAALARRLGDRAVRDRLRRELGMCGASGTTGPREGMIVALSHGGKVRQLEGRTLGEIARDAGVDVLGAACDLLAADEGRVHVVAPLLTEAQLEHLLAHPLAVVGSDGTALAADGPLARGRPHPRSFGAFPRLLGRYVRERGTLSLEDAVRRCTAEPARRLGLADRGRLRPGMAGDVVVFDPATVADTADYVRPPAYPRGIELVCVNGAPVVVHGEHTGSLPGRVL